MPVENGGNFFPRAELRFVRPDGPVTHEADNGLANTGLVEAESSPVTVDHSEIHQADSTGQFESPGPETVRVGGFDAPEQSSPADVELESPKEDAVQPDPAATPAAADPKLISTSSVQAKVVKPADSPPAAGTTGAEVK